MMEHERVSQGALRNAYYLMLWVVAAALLTLVDLKAGVAVVIIGAITTFARSA